jgi:hypothetical protein
MVIPYRTGTEKHGELSLSLSLSLSRLRRLAVWVIARRDNVVCAAIAVSMFAVLVYTSRNSHFWFDELYSMHTAQRGSLREVIAPSLNFTEPIPPFYYVCLWLWDKLLIHVLGAPIRELWYLLPSAALLALTVYIVGLTAKRLLGAGAPVWITCLLTATSVWWARVGLQLRYYPLQFFFTAVVVLLYVMLRSGNPPRHPWVIRVLLGASMALCAFTGYSALFWLAALFLVDLIFVVCRQLRGVELATYVFAAFAYSPWLVAIAIAVAREGMGRDFNSSWPATPKLSAIPGVYTTMLGDSRMTTFYIFSFFVVAGAALLVIKRQYDGLGFLFERWRAVTAFILSPALMIGLIFIYSRYLFPSGSIFVSYYFALLWPMLCLVMGAAIVVIARSVSQLGNALSKLLVLSLMLTLIFQRAGGWTLDVVSNGEFIRDVYYDRVQYLLRQPDIHSSGVVVYVDDQYYSVNAGWYDYYVTAQGTSPGFPVAHTVPTNAAKVYVCVHEKNKPPQQFYDLYTLDEYIGNLKVWIFVESNS